MIVGQVNIVDVSGFKTENHPPVSRDVDRPKPLEITLQTMQAITRKKIISLAYPVTLHGSSKDCSDLDACQLR